MLSLFCPCCMMAQIYDRLKTDPQMNVFFFVLWLFLFALILRSFSLLLLLLLARPHTCFSLSPTTRGHTHGRARNILPHRFPNFSFSFSLSPFLLSLFLHLTPKQSIYTSSLPPSNSDTTSVKSSRYQEFDTLSSLYPLFTLLFQEPPRGRPLLSLLPVVRENVHPLTLFNSLSLFQLLHRSNGQTSLQLPSHSSLLSFFSLLTSHFFTV